MSVINWAITSEDMGFLSQVVDRAMRELKHYPDDKLTLLLGLNACHSNGCPLDFKGLLAASMQDFSHDIYGIRNHIDRDTGNLLDCFPTRYALSNRVTRES